MDAAAIRQTLWLSAVVTGTGTSLRLLQLGLLRSYPYLWICLVSAVGRSLYLNQFDVRSLEYGRAWARIQPYAMLVEALAVAEVYRLITRNYRGMGRYGIALVGTLAAAAALLCWSTIGLYGDSLDWATAVPYVSRVRRFFNFALGGFLMLASAYFVFSPTLLPPNVEMHRRIALIYFSIPALSHLYVHATSGYGTAAANLVSLIAYCACFIGWTVSFTRDGEKAPPALYSASEVELRRAALTEFIRQSQDAPKAST